MAEGSFFKKEDTDAAVEALKAWMAKYPEASKELQEVWRSKYLTAGHKTMARELIKK